MSLTRTLLLAASQNRWLRDHATRYRFVRSSVSRFMPGETFDDAMQAAQSLRGKQIGTVFTHLGKTSRILKKRGRLRITIWRYSAESNKRACGRRFPSN